VKLPEKLSSDDIIQVIQANRQALQSCYEQARKRNTAINQKELSLQVELTVQPDGQSESITLTPADDLLMTDCMRSAISQWQFPSYSGQTLGVKTPITLYATQGK